MMPTVDRGPFGWNLPARVLLMVLALSFGCCLAWTSSGFNSLEVASPSLVVDANSAPASVLSALPGLGPVLAGRIVEVRELRPFQSLDDFDRRVKGIGPAKVEALRPYLRFDLVVVPKP